MTHEEMLMTAKAAKSPNITTTKITNDGGLVTLDNHDTVVYVNKDVYESMKKEFLK